MTVKVVIHTDGSCLSNQSSENFGGWGVVLQAFQDEKEIHYKEVYGSAINTTNNKMELTAVIEGLKKLQRKDIPVEVYADSNYVVQGINSWIEGWKKRGWRKSDKKPVENKDLWIELDNLVQSFDNIKVLKVKAHDTNELNNKADELAVKGSYEIKEASLK